MNIVSEKEMLSVLGSAKRVLLYEPKYRRLMPPMGLMKIAGYLKERKIPYKYSREYLSGSDLICVSTLFTMDLNTVRDTLRRISFFGGKQKVLMGGVGASIMPDSFCDHPKLEPMVFKGYSQVLDRTVPDYSTDWMSGDRYSDYSLVFTSRGCVNKCPYCIVPKIEQGLVEYDDWEKFINPAHKGIALMDNNFTACSRKHVRKVTDAIKRMNRIVRINGGFDCKFIDDEFIDCVKDLRYWERSLYIAFDRIDEDGTFQSVIKKMLKAGIPKSNFRIYVLYNFTDTPQEAEYRMRECVKLEVRVYPQRFIPLNQKVRKYTYVGKHWTNHLAKCFRHFYLLSGRYTKFTFEEYNKRFPDVYKLTEEDWSKWNSK